MSNNRKSIRCKLKNLMELDNNFDDVTIFSSRSALIVQNEQLPSITIITPSEPVTPESINRKRYIRKLELVFEVRVDATEDVDDTLDELLSKLEEFMLTNSNIGGTLLDSVQVNTETDIGAEGNKDIGLGTLTFECTYIS